MADRNVGGCSSTGRGIGRPICNQAGEAFEAATAAWRLAQPPSSCMPPAYVVRTYRPGRRTFPVHHHCLASGGDKAHHQRLVNAVEGAHARHNRAHSWARIVAAHNALPRELSKHHVRWVTLLRQREACGGDARGQLSSVPHIHTAYGGGSSRFMPLAPMPHGGAHSAQVAQPGLCSLPAPDVTCTLDPCRASVGRLLQLADSRRHSKCASG